MGRGLRVVQNRAEETGKAWPNSLSGEPGLGSVFSSFHPQCFAQNSGRYHTARANHWVPEGRAEGKFRRNHKVWVTQVHNIKEPLVTLGGNTTSCFCLPIKWSWSKWLQGRQEVHTHNPSVLKAAVAKGDIKRAIPPHPPKKPLTKKFPYTS